MANLLIAMWTARYGKSRKMMNMGAGVCVRVSVYVCLQQTINYTFYSLFQCSISAVYGYVFMIDIGQCNLNVKWKCMPSIKLKRKVYLLAWSFGLTFFSASFCLIDFEVVFSMHSFLAGKKIISQLVSINIRIWLRCLQLLVSLFSTVHSLPLAH